MKVMRAEGSTGAQMLDTAGALVLRERGPLLRWGMVVSCLLVAGFILIFFVVAEQRNTQHRALQMAGNLTRDVDQFFEAAITTLQALAKSTALATEDFASLYEEARQARGDADVVIVLLALNGKQLINTRVPWGTPLPQHGVIHALEAIKKTGRPQVTNVFIGPITQQPAFGVGVPIFKDGELTYVLGFSPTIGRFLTNLTKHALPTEWSAAVLDRNDVVVARSGTSGVVAKGPVFAATAQQRNGKTEGVFVATDLQDRTVLVAHVRSELSGWTISVWGPRSAIGTPFWRSWQLFAMLGATLLALILLFAPAPWRRDARGS